MTVLLSYYLTPLTLYLCVMVDLDYFRKAALSFDNTTEEPHFEKISFRWKGKIFSTYWEKRTLCHGPVIAGRSVCFLRHESGCYFSGAGNMGKARSNTR